MVLPFGDRKLGGTAGTVGGHIVLDPVVGQTFVFIHRPRENSTTSIAHKDGPMIFRDGQTSYCGGLFVVFPLVSSVHSELGCKAQFGHPPITTFEDGIRI